MPVTIPTPAPASSSLEIPEKTLLSALALTSFAALLLELALTRLFSVVLFYHFAFLAISIALLGLGAGGVFAYLLKSWFAARKTRTLAAWLCIANAVIVVAVLEVVLHVPVDEPLPLPHVPVGPQSESLWQVAPPAHVPSLLPPPHVPRPQSALV